MADKDIWGKSFSKAGICDWFFCKILLDIDLRKVAKEAGVVGIAGKRAERIGGGSCSS